MGARKRTSLVPATGSGLRTRAWRARGTAVARGQTSRRGRGSDPGGEMMKRIRRSAAFAALLMLAACSGTVRQPEIDLEGVSLGSLGLGGGTVNVNVRVHNPNRFSIRADDLKYRLFLRRPADQAAAGDSAWIPFADGTYGDTISVRGG